MAVEIWIAAPPQQRWVAEIKSVCLQCGVILNRHYNICGPRCYEQLTRRLMARELAQR